MIVMLAGIFGLLILDVNSQAGNRNPNSDWGFIISMFLIYGVGYPVGHTAVIGIFSKSKYIAKILPSVRYTCAR
jgi:ceroid-lipofuscinosis MFS transporter 7